MPQLPLTLTPQESDSTPFAATLTEALDPALARECRWATRLVVGFAVTAVVLSVVVWG